MLSLYQLYVGGGEPSASWQDKITVLPVVTEVGTLHTGGDGGTAGQNIQFLACFHMYSRTQRTTITFKTQNNIIILKIVWQRCESRFPMNRKMCLQYVITKESLPRTVSFTLVSLNCPLPETSQSYAPLSLRVTLENLRLWPLYIVTLPA